MSKRAPVTLAPASARLLVGRVITGYRGNPRPDGRGGTMHSPEIELDNGAVLTFTTEETNHGDYGTACTYARRLANTADQRTPRTRRKP